MANGGGHVCCAVGICCPPGSPKRVDALAAILSNNGSDVHPSHPEFVEPNDDHRAMAGIVIDTFDLAPAGTLAPLYDAIRAMAKKAGT